MKQTTLKIAPPKKLRMSAKLRNAIDLRVTKGLTIKDACIEAGMSEAGFHKAMKRPAVRDHLQEVRNRFISEVDGRSAIYKARAYEVAAELMESATSEAVRMRAVEFLVNGGKPGNSVNVHVDARPMGYEYVRPGQQLVEIQSEDEAP